MNPAQVKSFVTYYLQNLSERTRRERGGTKWGIDWIAYNIGLARFGKAVRLPFLRHGSEGFPKPKVEAEFGIDLGFISDDGTDLVIFVLKDEPLTNKTWTSNDFDRDLRMAIAPDLSAQGLERVETTTVILAYNKDDQQNGIEAYERFARSAPSKLADRVDLRLERWNLSDLVDETITHVLSPSIVPERFFGQLSYLAAQVADFRHGSDSWQQQLVPNWRRFVEDVLVETTGTRGLDLIPVALIVLREHAKANPSIETGWLDLIEWAIVAIWKVSVQRDDNAFQSATDRIWSAFYIGELCRFYGSHAAALAVEQSIDQLAGGTSVGAIAAGQLAHWHIARLGILALHVAQSEYQDEACRERRLLEVSNWLAGLLNANESALRPVVDLEHVHLALVFETFHAAGRLNDLFEVFVALEQRLSLRRLTDSEIPFIDGGNSLDSVLEQVATRPGEPLVRIQSSYFVLAMLEMCCVFEEPAREELLSKLHRHLVLGAVDIGEPGDRVPLDLVSWIPPSNWEERVFDDGEIGGEGVAVHQFGENRDTNGSEVLGRIRQLVGEMRGVQSSEPIGVVALAPRILAALKHQTPLPPEVWRRHVFSIG